MRRSSYKPGPFIPHAELLCMLRQLLSLLSLTAGWTTGALARDRHERAVHPLDMKAISWCLLGGCARIAWRHDSPDHCEERYDSLLQILIDIEPSLYTRTFPRFSDEEGRDRVLDVVRKGIMVQEARIHRVE